MKKVEKAKRKNGYVNYPETIAEAVIWDERKKILPALFKDLENSIKDLESRVKKLEDDSKDE